MYQHFERLKQSIPIGIPVEALNDQIEEIRKVDFSKLKIKSIVEFKKLDYTPDRIKKIKEGYNNIQKLKDYALQVNPNLQFFEVSATNGDGMEAWYDWLKSSS